MKWALYNLLFAAAYTLLLPSFLLRMFRRGGYVARFADRFALYPGDVRSRLLEGGRVWIHAVSVGEVQVAGQLMREWRSAEPSVKFCFSTTSSTGWKMAQREIGADDVLIYNPLDFPNFVKSALKTVKPRAIVLTESEIWPNFILRAAKMKIPLFLINARVSDRSAPHYRDAKFFFGDVLSAFNRIFAQSNLDRDRLLAAGADPARIEVTGSFKFDVARRNEEKERELGAWIFPGGEGPRAPLMLGASTWPGEDEVMLRIYRRLLSADSVDPVPLLAIAPRHFEKADAVEVNILGAGFRCVRRSRGDVRPADGGPAVFLADTTGELMGLFALADKVFVGKSLCARGSQNMIEPCFCGKPTAVGPHTENFRPVMSDLLESEAIAQVRDEAELERFFLSDQTALASRAAAAVERRRGVVGRCVRKILEEIA